MHPFCNLQTPKINQNNLGGRGGPVSKSFFLVNFIFRISSFNFVFKLCLHFWRPSYKKWIDLVHTSQRKYQSQHCFQGKNQAQSCFRPRSTDCSKQYWISDLITDFPEDTHTIDCHWSRINTSFNPTLAPKCTSQLYILQYLAVDVLELAGNAVLSIDKVYSYESHPHATLSLVLFFSSHIPSFEPPLISIFKRKKKNLKNIYMYPFKGNQYLKKNIIRLCVAFDFLIIWLQSLSMWFSLFLIYPAVCV